MTPDPYVSNAGGAGDPSDPQSWNKYSYTRGDPVNRFDPAGTCDQSSDTHTSVTVCADDDSTVPYITIPGIGGAYERGPGPAATEYINYENARTRLSKAAQAIENINQPSGNCQRDIAAIAAQATNPGQITFAAIQNALAYTTYYDGVGSQVSQSVLYPTSP
jgi:hypothetical protein